MSARNESTIGLTMELCVVPKSLLDRCHGLFAELQRLLLTTSPEEVGADIEAFDKLRASMEQLKQVILLTGMLGNNLALSWLIHICDDLPA